MRQHDYKDREFAMERIGGAARCGFVLVAVIVVLTLCVTLFGLWARAAVLNHRQLRSAEWRLQAARLAEAGTKRGWAVHAADAEFTTETWRVPATMLDKTHAAEVRIEAIANDALAAVDLQATADYPADSLHRVRLTKRIRIPNSTAGNEP